MLSFLSWVTHTSKEFVETGEVMPYTIFVMSIDELGKTSWCPYTVETFELVAMLDYSKWLGKYAAAQTPGGLMVVSVAFGEVAKKSVDKDGKNPRDEGTFADALLFNSCDIYGNNLCEISEKIVKDDKTIFKEVVNNYKENKKKLKIDDPILDAFWHSYRLYSIKF